MWPNMCSEFRNVTLRILNLFPFQVSNVKIWPLDDTHFLGSVYHLVTYINFNVMTYFLFQKIYQSSGTLPEVLSMFMATRPNGTFDNNLHISFDSAVPVLCCCTKYQQMKTTVLLHQMSVLANSLRYVDRTNGASSTDLQHARRISGWKLQTIFVR